MEDAKHYNTIEIPLKRTAEKLKVNNYILKTQYNILVDAWNRVKLKEQYIPAPINPNPNVSFVTFGKKKAPGSEDAK
jgi:hypothetical protein